MNRLLEKEYPDHSRSGSTNTCPHRISRSHGQRECGPVKKIHAQRDRNEKSQIPKQGRRTGVFLRFCQTGGKANFKQTADDQEQPSHKRIFVRKIAEISAGDERKETGRRTFLAGRTNYPCCSPFFWSGSGAPAGPISPCEDCYRNRSA